MKRKKKFQPHSANNHTNHCTPSKLIDFNGNFHNDDGVILWKMTHHHDAERFKSHEWYKSMHKFPYWDFLTIILAEIDEPLSR